MLYDASSVVHLRSSPRPTPATSTGDFSVTLTTTPHSTQQLTAVWNHRLNNDPEGPTFISNTALRSSDSDSYIRTSQSHSGHTAMTSRARPRRRLPPPAAAPDEAGRSVTDRVPGADRGMGAYSGGPGALSAPEAGDVTVSPWASEHVPGARPRPPRELSRWAQARRQQGERSSPDPGDSPHRDNAGREGDRGGRS
jgi:hypothetical protein